MHDYITNITLSKGSGEYCICLSSLPCASYLLKRFAAHILAPGAHARMPLVDRVTALKIPIAFICTCLLLCALTLAE